MPFHFLIPAHPLRPAVPDETFADQVAALRQAGFSVSLVTDAAIDGGKPLRGVPDGSTVVYRGWMFNAGQYSRLVAAVGAAGGRPLTSVEQYLVCHHIPHWYPLVAEFTPETRVLDAGRDYVEQLADLGWGTYFVKDFVKSLKTSAGSVVRDPADLPHVLAEMRRVRGEIEGGVVVRRFEAFIPGSERRYFVLAGVPYDPDGREPPPLVREVAARVPSPFFTADVVERADGRLRLVEVGDGQVSDLVGWTAQAFAEAWWRHAG